MLGNVKKKKKKKKKCGNIGPFLETSALGNIGNFNATMHISGVGDIHVYAETSSKLMERLACSTIGWTFYF